MKLNFIIAFSIILNVVCFSQIKKTDFEFKLYGEDAKGHKDSVIIGYSHDVSGFIFDIDTSFGDKNIGYSHFDSVFEMRVHKITYLNTKNKWELAYYGVSKRITLLYPNGNSALCTPYGKSNQGFLIMKVKYPPVKLSWDKNQFDRIKSPCVGKSYLLYNEYFTQESPPENIPFSVFMDSSSFLIDSLLSQPTQYIGGFPNNSLKEIIVSYSNATYDTLQSNYQFQFQNSSIRTSLDESVQIITQIYPNPCRGQINILLPSIINQSLTVNIYGINGAIIQTVNKLSSDIISIDTSPLIVGTYVVDIVTKEHQHYMSKFIKSY